MGTDAVAPTPLSALRELCNQAKVSDEARALLSDDFATKEFIAFLVEKEMFPDALRLIAHLLPKREAIGWGCLCLRYTFAEGKAAPDVQVAAERWVYDPSEENRWAARRMADAEDPNTASGLLALAVYFAGPSLAPPNYPQPVPPPPGLTSAMVANAVVLAGVAKDPEKANDKYRVFMQKAATLMARMQQRAQESTSSG